MKAFLNPLFVAAAIWAALPGCSAGDDGSAEGHGMLGGTVGGGGATGGGGSASGGGGSASAGSGSGGGVAGDVGGGVTGSIDISDAAAGTSGGGDGAADCGLQYFDLQRKPGEVLIVLDRSASMQDPPEGVDAGSTSKWDFVVPALNEVVTQTDAIVSWGLKVFPEGDGSECAAGSVTNNVVVPIAPMNASKVVAAVNATTPEGNGTPTGDAINAAVTYLKSIGDTNPKYMLLATDGDPSCAGTTKDSTQARTFAETAVMNAATQGYRTFVVGVNTTKGSSVSTLNQLAINGGVPQQDDPSPAAPRFYLANTKDDLVAALGTIATDVSDNCIFPLTKPPPQKDNIRVEVMMTKIPRDDTDMNGWAYTDATTVQVFGAWCDQIKTSGANQVKITYGCPKIDVR